MQDLRSVRAGSGPPGEPPASSPSLRCLTLSLQAAVLVPDDTGHCKKCYGCNVVLHRLPSKDAVAGEERTASPRPARWAPLRGPR